MISPSSLPRKRHGGLSPDGDIAMKINDFLAGPLTREKLALHKCGIV